MGYLAKRAFIGQGFVKKMLFGGGGPILTKGNVAMAGLFTTPEAYKTFKKSNTLQTYRNFAQSTLNRSIAPNINNGMMKI